MKMSLVCSGWRTFFQIGIIISLFRSQVIFGQSDQKGAIEWLSESISQVESLDFETENFSQFEDLVTMIGDKKIVLLGEQTHGDGSTFEAKALLVRFLHEEMGFNTLVFESDFYQTNKSWNELNKEKNYRNVFPKGMPRRWSDVKEMQPLFSYIQRGISSNNPLKLQGMDILFDGSYSNELLNDFRLFLQSNESSMLETKEFGSLEAYVEKSMINPNYLPSKEVRDNLLTSMDFIINELSKTEIIKESSESSFWSQVWKTYLENSINMWSRFDGSYQRSSFFNRRGRAMADNLEWITEKNEKIIVWAASNHNFRNFDHHLLSGMGWSLNTKYMGQYFSEKGYENDMVHIAFTGCFGYYADIYNNYGRKSFKPKTNDSLEGLLLQTGIDFGYFSLGDDKPSTRFTKPFEASFVFNQQYSASWSDNIDIVFFVRNMKESTILR